MEDKELELLLLEKERRKRQSNLTAPTSIKENLFNGAIEGISKVPSRIIEHLSGISKLPAEIEGLVENGPPRFGKNLLAGGAKLGRSIANIPPNILEALGMPGVFPRAPEFDIDKTLGLDETLSGDSLAQALTEKIPSGIAAAYGYAPLMATEALQAIGNKENPLTSALTSAIERFTGKTAIKASKEIPKYVNSLSQTKTANKTVGIINDTNSYFKEGYDKILSDPRLPKNVELNVNPLLVSQFKKAAPGFADSLVDALESGNLAQIHTAASDLGHYAQGVKIRGSKASSRTQKAAKNANKIKHELEKTLDTTLSKEPNLKEAYRALDQEYIKKGVPITAKIKEGTKLYEQGLLEPNDFLRRLRAPAGGELFRKAYGHNLPGIKRAIHPEAYNNVPGMRGAINILRKGFPR